MLLKQAEKTKKEFETLQEKKKQLKNPEHLEFLARDQLGYSYKGEVIYRAIFPEEKPKGKSS